MLYGPIFVGDAEKDFELVDFIVKRDYSDRFLPKFRSHYSADRITRPLLSPARSLGSVIKLLTPSPLEYTAEYNDWLRKIPKHVLALVFIIKRFYKPEWNDNWQTHFGVDIVNGTAGHELKYENRRLVGSYLRVGLTESGTWRTYKLRQDFIPAEKVQQEDDISASVVVPPEWVQEYYKGNTPGASLKLVSNCEYRLFQRPDDAVHRGYDKQTELDMSRPGNFISNYQPLTKADAIEMVEDTIHFEEFSAPMRNLIRAAAESKTDCYVVSSAQPRLVNGKPTENPRYLQVRPTLVAPISEYLAEIGARLNRRLSADAPVIFPVNAVLAGRRNNPPDVKAGIRALAVYNPIHFQELPELFMDFICSLTGKSPSTTGAGTEGALTKGPFNAMPATADLNNALVSMILTGADGFTTAAGYVGPHIRVNHDISLLVPEVWCRLQPSERSTKTMIAEGFLEKLEDFEFGGKTVLASRLGYRITQRFVHVYFGRVFDNPTSVFDEAILKPETQGMEVYVDGIANIVEAQQRVALSYFEDGTIEFACPPLKALIHIMAHGNWEGKTAADPSVRALFTKESLLQSDWYRERLLVKRERDAQQLRRSIAALRAFIAKPSHEDQTEKLGLRARLTHAEKLLSQVLSLDYLKKLRGTIGADPIAR